MSQQTRQGSKAKPPPLPLRALESQVASCTVVAAASIAVNGIGIVVSVYEIGTQNQIAQQPTTGRNQRPHNILLILGKAQHCLSIHWAIAYQMMLYCIAIFKVGLHVYMGPLKMGALCGCLFGTWPSMALVKVLNVC